MTWLTESTQPIKSDLPEVEHKIHPLLGFFTNVARNIKVFLAASIIRRKPVVLGSEYQMSWSY